MTLETKEEAMQALETSRSEWLGKARAAAVSLARDGRAITVNDVRPVAPTLPDDVDPRVWGAVFNTPDWEFVRYVPSLRRTSHNRPVAQHRLVR